MPMRVPALLLCALSFVPSAFAKDKKQAVLPIYILQAKTVAVLIDPNAGVDVSDPQRNRTARKDVEAALTQWGRFDVILDSATADLLIVVRRGNGKPVNATIPDPQQNRRRGVLNSTDDGVTIGGQRGRQPNTPGDPGPPSIEDGGPRMETGRADDSFLVYQGQIAGQSEDPLDAPPGWRYITQDALRPHTVPAVDAFRKAVAEAEKSSQETVSWTVADDGPFLQRARTAHRAVLTRNL